MKVEKARNRVLRKVVPVACVVAFACVALVACGPQSVNPNAAGDKVNAEKQANYTADATEVVSMDNWIELYPSEAASLKANADDDSTYSYLEERPFLATIYEGTPFSKQYDRARGHTYTLTDVQETARIGEKTKASCYACKGPYYPVNEDEGTDLYTQPFAEATAEGTAEGTLTDISCYDCHLNNPSSVLAARDFFNEAYPTAAKDWGASAAACGQCHNEYYFDDTTKAVTLPAGLTDPTAMLNYYNAIGFVDYTNPSTGTKQLKAQHPEVQMFAGSTHQMAGLSCVDCHMERTTDEQGNAYTSHELVNPSESEIIQNTVCTKCHASGADQIKKVDEIQQKMFNREDEVGKKLETLTNKLKEAVASGKYSEEELNAVRDLNRSAQWYWDYEFVENSDGFHNVTLANSCMDLSEQLADQAIALLNK